MSSKEHGVGNFQKEADQNQDSQGHSSLGKEEQRHGGLMFLVTFNKGRSMNMKDHRQGQC